MGILNMTPDSFSDGGIFNDFAIGVNHGVEMSEAGAGIIDIGGESTRPGSEEVDPVEEMSRVLDVACELVGRGMRVSIDTRHPRVAQTCVERGIQIMNDISGFSDPEMIAEAARSEAGCIICHMKGEPKTMQDDPLYDDVVSEVYDYLIGQAGKLEAAGVARDRICLDPGIGFGKSTEDNLEILEATDRFVASGYPVLIGASRKRFLGTLYGDKEPTDRLWSSVAVAVRAAAGGAQILRVHDVSETLSALAYLRQPFKRAFIALGANQGDRVEELRAACEQIDRLPATRVVATSTIYESAPAYYLDQDTFANAVVEVETHLHPRVLLAELNRIELAGGRVRSIPNGPRKLDLDIIDYEGLVLTSGDLILPHPRALEREFVIRPLMELTADEPDFRLADESPLIRGDVVFGKIIGVLGRFDDL